MKNWQPIALVALVTSYFAWTIAAPFTVWMLLPIAPAIAILLWYRSRPERFFRSAALTSLGVFLSSAIGPNIQLAMQHGRTGLKLNLSNGGAAVTVTSALLTIAFGLLEYWRTKTPPDPPSDGARRTHKVIAGKLENTGTIVSGDYHHHEHHDDSSHDKLLDTADALLKAGALQQCVAMLLRLEQESGPTLTLPRKIRQRRLLGTAYAFQEEDQKAATCLLEAYALAPNDLKMKVLHIQAHLLKADQAGAHRLAAELRMGHPEAPEATALWIKTAPESIPTNDLHPKPWESLNELIAVALAERLNGAERFNDSERLLKAVAQSGAFSHYYWNALSIAILESELVDDPRVTAHPIRMAEATSCIDRGLEQLKGEIYPSLRAAQWLNKALINRKLGNKPEQWACLKAALSASPSDTACLARRGEWLLEEGKFDEAVLAFRPLSDANPISIETVFFAQVLIRRGGPGDIESARQILERIMAETADSKLRRDAADQYLNSYQVTSSQRDGLVLLSVNEAKMSPFRAAEWKLMFYMQLGDAQSGKAIGASLYGDRAKWNAAELNQLGVLLWKLELFDECVSVLVDIAPRSRLRPSTTALIRAAEKLSRWELVVRICAELMEAGIEESAIMESFMLASAYAGHIKSAIDAATKYLTKHDDSVIRLQMESIAASAGRHELLSGDRRRLPPPRSGNGRIAQLVVGVLRAANQQLQAVDYAYENFRLNRSDQSAWRAVLESLWPPTSETLLPWPDKVIVGTSVRYRELDGGAESQWATIEVDAPDFAHGEYGETHKLVVAMLGLTKGQEFDVSRWALPPARFVIEEILDKRVHCYQRCIVLWERAFPGVAGVATIKLDETHTTAEQSIERVVSSLRVVLKASRDHRNEALQLYDGNNWCSMFLLARALDTSVFGAMEVLSSTERDVRCAVDADTALEMRAALREATSVLVDATAIATLLQLGQVSLLGRCKQRLVVSEGTMLELSNHLRGLEWKGPGATVGLEGESVVFQETNSTAFAAYKEQVMSCVQLLRERAEVFSEAGNAPRLSDDEVAVWRQFGGLGGPDTVGRAMRTGEILWTDDAAIGNYVAQKGVRSVWTQLFASEMFDTNELPGQVFYAMSAKLVGWRFVPTVVSPQLIVAAAELAGWNAQGAPYAEIGRLLRSERWSTTQAGGLVLHTIPLLWRHATVDENAVSVMLALFDAMAARRDSARLIGAVLAALPHVFGVDVLGHRKAMEALAKWNETRVAAVVVPKMIVAP